MVCSSIIFIPGIMIYEWIKAWKTTKYDQNHVKECLFEGFLLIVVFRFGMACHIIYEC
jgi:hypothetical protein